MIHHVHFLPFGFIFFLLIAGLIVMNIIMWRRGGRGCYHKRFDALNMLGIRLAKGEISIEEYNHVKEILKNN